MQAGAGFAKTSPYYIVQQGKACWVCRLSHQKSFINLSATWFSDNMCVCVRVSWKFYFYCMFYYMFRKPLICFRIHPLFRVFKRWASWPRWPTLNVWCFWRRGCFLVVAEVKRSIETCRLKQSWVFNHREDHWTNLLKYWRHVCLRSWWFCRYEFRPQHHCIWLVCWSLKA